MFCPSCRSEFNPDYRFCQNCEVDLVPQLVDDSRFRSAATMAAALNGKKLQPIMTATQSDLLKAQATLTTNNILSILANESGDEQLPAVASRLFLLIATEDVDKAAQCLHQDWHQELTKEGIVQTLSLTDSNSCPACMAVVEAQLEDCPECGLYVGNLEN